jgi:divalent metal cation (Fe/Co/Zn/Cd) transporter
MNVVQEPCCSATTCGNERASHVQRALRLEYLTVGWNVLEGIVAIGAALAAGSVALLGFGIDSFVECTSGAVMIWRLRAEQTRRLSSAALEQVEHRARRLVAVSLFLLAAFVMFEAVRRLLGDERPEFSAIGVGLTSLSLVVMYWLARAKRHLAAAIKSRALEGDAFQTTACMWLSAAALIGIGLNGALGWWWADPLAAIIIGILIAREARQAWKGEDTCCP